VTHHHTSLYLCVCPKLLGTAAVRLVLRKQRILDHIHKYPTLVPNWSQIDPVHSHSFPSRSTLIPLFCTSRCHRWSQFRHKNSVSISHLPLFHAVLLGATTTPPSLQSLLPVSPKYFPQHSQHVLSLSVTAQVTLTHSILESSHPEVCNRSRTKYFVPPAGRLFLKPTSCNSFMKAIWICWDCSQIF
jgi:hypothetical protein